MRNLWLMALAVSLLASPAPSWAKPKPKPKASASKKAARPEPKKPPKKEAPAPAPAASADLDADGSDEAAFPFSMTVRTLPNGLTYILVPYDSPGLAAYYTLVRVGSRNEVEPGRSGFAHFFEHMMFRGTEKVPAQMYEDLLAKAGVANNAFTTDDFTAYHAFGPSSQLPLLVELESDRFQNLKYSEDAFRTEAKAVLGEYNKSATDPAEKMDEALHDIAFTAHSYKHTTMGFKEDIEAMPGLYAYSLEFFKRWYTPDNTFLVLVGDFDVPKTEELIKKHYGSWQGKAASITPPAEPRQNERRAVHLSWDSPAQSRLILAWRTPETRVDTRSGAIQNVLGPFLFGPTSPAYQTLVLEKQLVSDLSQGYFNHRDPSLFSVIATLKSPEAFEPVRAELLKAVSTLRGGMTEDDGERLDDVKSNQKYGVLNTLDKPDSVALHLVFAIGPTGKANALNVLFNRIDKLAPQHLVDFAKTHLADAAMTEVTLTGPGVKPPPGSKEYTPTKAGAAAAAKSGGVR